MILFASDIFLKRGYDRYCYFLFFSYCTFVHMSVSKSPATDRTGFTSFVPRSSDPAEREQKKIYKHRWLGHVRRTNRKHGFIVLHRRKPRLNAGQARLPDASTGTVFGNNVFQTTDVHVRSGRKSNSNRWQRRERQFVFLFLFLLVLFVRFSSPDQFLHPHTGGCYIVSSATPNHGRGIRRQHQFSFRKQRQTWRRK